MVNSELIKDRMREKNKTQRDIADALRLKTPTVSLKINNKRPLFLDEAEKIAKILDISDDEFGSYFFSHDVA
ncbi:MAG: helix-turn-helix domain-containing protein [Christensenellales bacterium]